MNTVITSFTEAGYKTYGKDFIESFREFWPAETNLVIYYEGDNIREDWHFIEEVEGLDEHIDNLRFPMMRGNLGDGSYEIQLDAGMCRKSFMQAHACKVYGGKVFWIDADVVTHTKVPADFLDKMLPDNRFCCYLGRDPELGWTFPAYTESGFLGFNAKHPLCFNFLGAYLAVIQSGMIFTRDSWHDCMAFDTARSAFSNVKEEFINLSSHLKPDSTPHPFINTDLGKYMDHKKGTRKDHKSRKEDIIVDRDEPYWKEIIV